jgi:hypothetical protein
MTLLMRDSIEPFSIPLDNLDVVAGYADGNWLWPSPGWARFQPPIVSLSIVVSANDQGDILDVEIGDATPADVPGWVRRFNRPGRRKPTIYSNRSTWSRMQGSPALTIVEALQNAGIQVSSVDWWASTLDGTQFVPGAVAVQYAGSDRTGGNYDESIIWDTSWIGEGFLMALSDDQQSQMFNNISWLIDQLKVGNDPNEPVGGPWIANQFANLPTAIASAVVKALPPASAGGITQEQVQQAVATALANLTLKASA